MQKGSVSTLQWGGGVVATEEPLAGSWAGSVVRLLFDVLNGNRKL